MINPSKYGFETDNLGVLVEVRGDPASSVEQALANFLAKEMIAKGKASTHGYTLSEEPSVKLTDEEILKITDAYHDLLHDKLSESRRKRSSAPTEKFKITVLTAGLHIHFSKQETKKVKVYEVNNEITLHISSKGIANPVITKKLENEKELEVVCNTFIDMPLVISTLDSAFENEIKSAGRVLGAYEIKDYGFEYRSLPANIDLVKVAGICTKLFGHF